jgi:hypothetical protein
MVVLEGARMLPYTGTNANRGMALNAYVSISTLLPGEASLSGSLCILETMSAILKQDGLQKLCYSSFFEKIYI